MKSRYVLIVAVVLGFASMKSFGADPPKAQKIDADLAKQATAVLRVKLLKAAQAVEKYGWDQVEILDVLKNESRAEFAQTMEIAFRNADPGVPKGESTVYLVPYCTPPDGRLWRLVASSHVEGPKKAEQSNAADSR
jgi:hypothetical protein